MTELGLVANVCLLIGVAIVGVYCSQVIIHFMYVGSQERKPWWNKKKFTKNMVKSDHFHKTKNTLC